MTAKDQKATRRSPTKKASKITAKPEKATPQAEPDAVEMFEDYASLRSTLMDRVRAGLLGDGDITVNLGSEYESKLKGHLYNKAITELARDLFESENFTPPPSSKNLTEALATDREHMQPLIFDSEDSDQRLLWHGQTLLLVAKYKIGKTPLLFSVIKALADGSLFLGRFKVQPPDGAVAVWNYELPETQWNDWAEDVGIENTDGVCALHLRGYNVDLMTDVGREWTERWLSERSVSTWIIDTWGAAYRCEENDNSAGGQFYERIHEIARAAGVTSVIITIHQGDGASANGSQKRARGAHVVHDRADVFWTYTGRGKERLLKAEGRDVDYPMFSVTFNPATRGLTYEDEQPESRADDKVAVESWMPRVLEHVQQVLGEQFGDESADQLKSRTTTQIASVLGDNDGVCGRALRRLEAAGQVHHIHGPRNAMWWFPGNGRKAGVKKPCPKCEEKEQRAQQRRRNR